MYFNCANKILLIIFIIDVIGKNKNMQERANQSEKSFTFGETGQKSKGNTILNYFKNND